MIYCVHRHAFKQEHKLCLKITDDPLIGGSKDKFGEFLNSEKEFLDYFVDIFKSDNEKIKDVMKEVVFDHFQLTEEKFNDYLELARQTHEKLDGITEKLDLSATKLDHLIATNSDKILERKFDYLIEILLEHNVTPQRNREEEEVKCSLQQDEKVPSENGHTNRNSHSGNGVINLKRFTKDHFRYNINIEAHFLIKFKFSTEISMGSWQKVGFTTDMVST